MKQFILMTLFTVAAQSAMADGTYTVYNRKIQGASTESTASVDRPGEISHLRQLSQANRHLAMKCDLNSSPKVAAVRRLAEKKPSRYVPRTLPNGKGRAGSIR